MYQTLTTDSQRQKTKNTCGKILGNIGLFLLVFLAAVPVLWLIYLSLKSNTDILTNPLALPDTLHWENYVNAYKTIPFYSMVKNTGIVILISVPVSMLLSIFAAFALGRMRFGSGKVQNGVYSYFVCGVIMPTCVMILPIYLVMVKVGLYDTLWSTILTHISRSFFADSSYMLSFSVLCSCVCSRLISPSVSSWHKQDNTLMHQSPGHIQRRTPYNF